MRMAEKTMALSRDRKTSESAPRCETTRRAMTSARSSMMGRVTAWPPMRTPPMRTAYPPVHRIRNTWTASAAMAAPKTAEAIRPLIVTASGAIRVPSAPRLACSALRARPLVDAHGLPCGLLPGEALRLFHPAMAEILPEGSIVGDPRHRIGEVRRVLGIDEERSLPGHLGQRRAVGRDHGGSAGHGLDDGQAKALVQRRIHEGQRTPHERGQI